MMNLDPQKRPNRATWLALGGFAVLAFLAAAALPETPDAAAGDKAAAAATPVPVAASDANAVTDKAAAKRPLQAPRAPDPLPATRTLISLAAVLALIVIAAFGASRWLKKLRIRPGGDRVLDVVDAVPLGPKRQIYVVSAYGRRLVIGASGDRLCLLSEIDEEETGESEPVPFDARLKRRLEVPAATLEAEA